MEYSLDISEHDQNSGRKQNPDKHETSTSIISEDFFQKYTVPNALFQSAFRLFGEEDEKCHSQDSGDSDSQQGRRPRGIYRKYTFQEKQMAVERIQNGEDVKAISKQYGIPRRNLLRWRKNGCERKQGGGRPTDRDMQSILYDKIKNQVLLGEKMIREEAIKLSKSASFKASKGWFLKFCRRYRLALIAEAPTNPADEI